MPRTPQDQEQERDYLAWNPRDISLKDIKDAAAKLERMLRDRGTTHDADH